MADLSAPFATLSEDADDASSSRARRRDSLFLTARFCVDGLEPVEVRVRNLSEGGLMAEGAPPLAIGTEVRIDLRNIGSVAGTVAWYTAGRAGVAFDVAIDPKQVRKPVAVRPAQADRPKRLPC